MTYGDFKALTRRTASDKILRDKAFNIVKNPKHDGYQRGLVSMVYKIFDKQASIMCAQSKTLATRNKFNGTGIKNEGMSDQQLAEELHKLIIRNFQKRNVNSSFIDNICGAGLAVCD